MANAYLRLMALLPTTPRQVGEVTSVSSAQVFVELVGGGIRKCQGAAEVGSMVYVEGDQIIGESPSLPVVTIEV